MGLFDDLTPGNAGSFADLIPKPKPRGLLGLANDTVISAANQIAGGVGSIASAIVPGNRLSQFIDEDIVKAGEDKQSDIVKQSRARFQAEMEAAQGGWDEAAAVGRYVADNPMQTLAQAAGALALVGLPMSGIGKFVTGLRTGMGATEAAAAATAAKVSSGAGAALGGLMSGGDAAGTAYELVQKTPLDTLMLSPQAQELSSAGLDEKAIRDELGTRAARAAMPIPTLIGAGSGLIGAERILAGGKPLAGGALARGAQTALVEGGGEFVDEAATQYFGQKGAAEYNPTIAPTKGVVGAGLLGMALGAPTGGVVGALSKGRDPLAEAAPPGAPDPVAKVLDAGSIDEAIQAATEATTAPVAPPTPRFTPYTEEEANAALMRMESEMAGLGMRWGNNDKFGVRDWSPLVPQPGVAADVAAAQNETAFFDEQRRIAAADRAETEREQRVAAAGAAPVDRAPRTGSRDAVMLDTAAPNAVEQFIQRQSQINTPAARAFVQEFRAGRITADDVMDLLVPSRLDPTPDARLAAAAAQAPKSPEGFLLTSDGFPYGSRIDAQARANKEGGEVVRVEGGFAVRPAEVAPVAPVAPTAAAPVAPVAPAPAAAAQAAPDAPRVGGFTPAPNGYKVRVSQHEKGSNALDPTADVGAFIYEVRKGDDDPNPLTMVLNKDGKLVPAQLVLEGNKSNGTAWVPPSAEAAAAVRALLEKRAGTNVGSPERAAVDAEIAAAVKGGPTAPAAPAAPQATESAPAAPAPSPVKRTTSPDGKNTRFDFKTTEGQDGRVMVAAPGWRKGVNSYEVTIDRVGGPRDEKGQTKFYPTVTIGKYRSEASAIKAAEAAVEQYRAGGQPVPPQAATPKPAATPADPAAPQLLRKATNPERMSERLREVAFRKLPEQVGTENVYLQDGPDGAGFYRRPKLSKDERAKILEAFDAAPVGSTLRYQGEVFEKVTGSTWRMQGANGTALASSFFVDHGVRSTESLPTAAPVEAASPAPAAEPAPPPAAEKAPTAKPLTRVEKEQADGVLVKPATLAEFSDAIAEGKRAYYDYAGTDARTLWIEETPKGWVLKDRDEDTGTVTTKGGAGIGGGWGKYKAEQAARETAEFRFTKWKPLADEAPSPVAAPRPAPEPKPAPAPSANTIFTEDAAAAARARLKAKLGRTQSGIDPETMMDGITLAGYHIEKGARTFAAYARAMVDDLGEAVKPYLKSWYMGVKFDPRASGWEMDGAAAVEAASLDVNDDRTTIGPDLETEPVADDTGSQETADDTASDGADSAEALGGKLPQGNPEIAGGVAPAAGSSVRPADKAGNGRAGRQRADGRTGMGRGKKPVLPDAPAEVRPVSRSPVSKEPDAQNQLFGDAPSNFEITADDKIGEGTEGQKLRANMEAIRTLRRIQQDDRNATPEEQAVMAKFVGWGGLRKLIDPNTTGKQWLDARAELLGTNGQPPLLVDGAKGSEWIALQRSTTAAHFTAPEVVTSMWDVVRHFGFSGGRVLEPTSGIGNFIGLQPRDLSAASDWHGAELDILTGQMAKLIYPEASIAAGIGFENVPFAKGAFDLAIGNPPFGSLPLKSTVAAYKAIPEMKIHNFIISKTGEHLRPGGVMAMVVTHRFLDTSNPEAREHLAKSFKFLGAFRLPNDAFLKNAGTEVTTDVVFLQKLHVGEKADDLSWLDTEGEIKVDGEAIRVNRYYEKNPGNILGRSAMDGTMYAGRQGEGRGEYTVHSDGRDLQKAIAGLLEGPWADLKDVAKATNADAAAAAVMIQQSDLPVGGVMLDGNGKLLRRDMDDEGGNAVVVEVTPASLWRDDAEKWKRVFDLFAGIKAGKRSDDADSFKAAVAIAYSAKGEKKPKPTKAEQAIYDVADALDRPGFAWRFDEQLRTIEDTLQRRRLGDEGYQRLKGMLGLRNTTLALIEAERRDSTDMKDLRARLNAEYDAFVESYGFVNESDNAKLLDGDVGVESGLETGFRPKNGKTKASANKADIFARRVNFPYREVTSAKDAADGLQVSLSERGRLDLQYIAKLTGQSVPEVIADLSTGDAPLIFLNPETNQYDHADQYLSGNVKAKLEKAKDAGLQANIKALEAVQPAPKTKDNVRPSIRGAWMPESVFEDFLTDLGARSPKITIIPSQGMILASSNSMAETEFGAQFRNPHKSAVELFNSAASGKPITMWVTDSKGNRSKNETATKEVNLLVERMAKVFNEWAWSNDTRIKQVVDAFNDKMNTHVARTYDGNKYLRPVGASPSISLRTTQKNAAWRIVQAPTVLLDHVVGAGKTYTIITGAMQRRRLGLSRKPMIVVPNHLVTQWARDYYALYPGAKVLAATPEDFAKNKRRRLFSRIATGDFDAIIIGHSSLSFIETPMADQQMVVNEQITELNEVLNELKKKKESGRTLTQIQEKLQKYESKLKELQALRRDEIGIDLEKMGVDYLAVDEMHEFKNLEYSTGGERVVGMNDPKGSKKAFDLYIKTRGLLARGGAVTGATGTPVSNSLVELYTMMKYLAHKDLSERNQLNFDAWAGAYARTETKLEYTATQKLKPRRVLAGLNNLSALKQLYEQFADVINMADLKRMHAEDVRRKNAKDGTSLREAFPVPKVKGGGRVLDSGPITEAQSTYMDYLVARMQAIEANKRNKEYARIDNPLYVLTDARKMSLDIRIVDPTAPRDENGKVMRTAAKVFDTYNLWEKDRGTQLIFCDLSTPAKNAVKEARRLVRESVEKLFGTGADGKRLLARVTALDTFSGQWALIQGIADEVMENPNTDQDVADGMAAYIASLEDVDATMSTADVGFSVYDDMRAVLIEKGIPEAEIAFIHDYNTPEQKAKLFADVNEGVIRVLMGSSAKMGAGTNAQRRLVAEHHMDAPWRPSDVEQREGRIIRQGNMLADRDPDNFEVEITAYSTAGTSDAVMWQVLERKARAIEEFRSAGLDHTDEEGSDSNQYAEFMAQSTGNPVFRLKLEAEREVDVLDTDSRGALLARSQAQRFLQSYDEDVAVAQGMLDYAATADVSSVEVAGEKGTAEEFEAAETAAREKYSAAYAAWLERRSAANAELDAWNALTELERGDSAKPTIPSAPSMPGVTSAGMLKASGYARAIQAALSRATPSGYEFKFGTLRMRVRQSLLKEDDWVLQTWNGASFETYTYGTGKTADASQKLAAALAPNALRALARDYGYEGKRRLADLKAQYDTKVKLASRQIDTDKLEKAKERMEWLRSQVSFAEQQADIRRSERPNRYITADKKRPLQQARAQDVEKAVVEFDGETFSLTGFRDGNYMQAVGPDGREVLLFMPLDKKGQRNAERIVEKPRGIDYSGLMRPSDRALEQAAMDKWQRDSGAITPPFSRAPGARGRVSVRDARAAADALRTAFPKAPQIRVLEKVNQAPRALLEDIRAAGAEFDVEAAFHKGEIFVFPGNIESIERLQFVMAKHEIRHAGLRSMLGEGMDRTMLAIYDANPSIARAADAKMAARLAGSRVEAVDEALADMSAEDIAAMKGARPLLAKLRLALRRLAGRLRAMGWTTVADAITPSGWSDADVVALVLKAESMALRGQTDGTRFSRAQADEAIAGTVDEPVDETRFSRSLGDTLRAGVTSAKDAALPAGYKVADFLESHGKITAWDRTVGTPYNLSKRFPDTFGRVFDGLQSFLNDITSYATKAADLAPSMLPKLESIKDIGKSPLSAEDTKAISAPIFEGTLAWVRDKSGKPVRIADAEKAAESMTVEQKAQEMLQARRIDPRVLTMWQGMEVDQYTAAINTRYSNEMLRAGVVWTDDELRSMFKLTGKRDAKGKASGQIALYDEFRKATNRSLDDLAISEMLQLGGEDTADMRDAVQAMSALDASTALRDRLYQQAAAIPDRESVLNDAAEKIVKLGDKVADLQARGYAPLSRFGTYTLDVVNNDGERVYFGLFESQYEANRMRRKMREAFPKATITQGTTDTESFKLFRGISPETLELFGEILGLDSTGDSASDQAFQQYLKRATATRSAMKRLIHRKGTAGFSEDAGRVLAGFLTSNARRTAGNLNLKATTAAVEAIPKEQGELKGYAAELLQYTTNPVEEAAAVRGMLFFQYLGGSVASAMVNMTQPLAVTMPYLSQFGGAKKAAKQVARAFKDMAAGKPFEDGLAQALKAAEVSGIVQPQEIHSLMAQARGKGSLRSGDGTRVGNAAATVSNGISKGLVAWGQLFAYAEIINRRSTFIAAFRTAVERDIADPAKFAAEAVTATQFLYTKANRPRWARGAIGATIFTFKQYGISYLELLARMAKSGPEGRKAALLAIAVLFLMSGVDGLPFMEDAEDIIDGFMQRVMGRNWSTKQKRNEVLAEVFGKDIAAFLQNGVSGIPGVPFDVSGRMGLGNLIPGTGLLRKDSEPGRDMKELLGPVADLAERTGRAAGMVLQGDVGRAALEVSPVAARNVAKGADMIETGTYRDAKGRKVIDTTATEAIAKMAGFQPATVARVQEATATVQRAIALNKTVEAEIADQWAQGLYEKDADKVAAARERLRDWNAANEDMPIRITFVQIRKRLQAMNQDKATRMEKTAPKEIRREIRRELAEVGR